MLHLAREKDALNLLFLLIPLVNVVLPFAIKSFPVIFAADVVTLVGVYAWKGVWDEVRRRCNVLRGIRPARRLCCCLPLPQSRGLSRAVEPQRRALSLRQAGGAASLRGVFARGPPRCVRSRPRLPAPALTARVCPGVRHPPGRVWRARNDSGGGAGAAAAVGRVAAAASTVVGLGTRPHPGWAWLGSRLDARPSARLFPCGGLLLSPFGLICRFAVCM